MRTDLSDANLYGLTLYSEKEKGADKILRAIVRASDAATIWNKEHPSVPLSLSLSQGWNFPVCGFLEEIRFKSSMNRRQTYYHEK